MSRVLFISPVVGGIYCDIIQWLERLGLEVTFIKDKGSLWDYNFIRYKKFGWLRENLIRPFFTLWRKVYWLSLLCLPKNRHIYDYLFVIDGMSISKTLFDILKRRNKELYSANYLFDTTYSLYKFQNNFTYFNKVASFDLGECEKYDLMFLPIYWIDSSSTCEKERDVFAFGAYSRERELLFKRIKSIADKNGWSYFIELYQPKSKMAKIKSSVATKKNIENNANTMLTDKTISPVVFRELINSSRVIVDSVNHKQDGMTARFMWALGLGKKIITTNSNIVKYSCYDERQILLLNSSSEIEDDSVESFIKSEYSPTINNEMVLGWRIDHWLESLLEL